MKAKPSVINIRGDITGTLTSKSAAKNSPLRERRDDRQQRIEAELIAAGMEMFCDNGFEATKIVDIAQRVGISRRTFFRYFAAKDDLVFHWLDAQGELISQLLKLRPENEHPALSMQQGYLALAAYLDAEDEQMFAHIRLILSEPCLRRRYHEENEKWENKFANVVKRDKSLSKNESLSLQIYISTTTTAFVIATRYWSMDRPRSSLLPWVKRAFAEYPQ